MPMASKFFLNLVKTPLSVSWKILSLVHVAKGPFINDVTPLEDKEFIMTVLNIVTQGREAEKVFVTSFMDHWKQVTSFFT